MNQNLPDPPHPNPPPREGREDLVRQPLIEHLIEFKKRMLISFAAFVVMVCVCYGFAEPIYHFLVQPLASAFPEGEHRRMIYTGLTEAFFTYLKLAMFAGFFLSFPVIAAQFYYFLAPGLYKNERRVLIPYLAAAPVLFTIGAAFVYYLIFPAAWRFFLGFEHSGAGGLPIQLEARVGEYLSLSMHLILAFGLSFQLPLVLILLVKSGMMRVDTLRRGRRYAIVIIVTVAAFITPPDVFSQIALSVPLYVLYEMSILICNRRHPERSEGSKDSSASSE
ncbi:MAG: twin-arginine translocase subunit TatC [Rickettsiales bacterium]|jgi:sec-independent protein translocase protein TatC|nr:twin-arginine translocase subunit TatC [Rickettsiales bacterium]